MHNRDTLKREYRQFLAENFGGLRLRKPLFYSWPCGLRFDLQTEGKPNDEYFKTVVERASAIFENAFDRDDNVIIAFADYKEKRQKIRLTNYVFRQIDKLDKNEICFTGESSVYEPTDSYNIALIRLKANRVNHKNILTAIGNSDFSTRQPRLDDKGVFTSKEIYFINPDKKLIFHMYDDRGLDVIASDRETLRPIYQKHTDWILDYDREQIDNLFE